LTRDPSWGEGDAVISGAEVVEGSWKQATEADVPKGMPTEGVWYIDLGADAVEPWAVWTVGDAGDITRIDIARDPNWTLSNPADPKEEWAEWTWPSKEHEAPIGTRKGVDEALKGKPEDFFEGVYCWTEWGGGIWGAMSLQYRSPVIGYDPEKGALDRVVISPIFDGWVVAGDRYFLEKHPSYLDAPGEYYFEAAKRCWPTAADRGFPWEVEWKDTGAEHAGRLYLRLPGDADPNDTRVEVGVRDQGLRILDQDHIEVSGLSFSRFNVPYRPMDLNLAGWDSYDIQTRIALENFLHPAAIMLGGDTSHIRVANNRFTHVPAAVKGQAWRARTVPDLPAFPDLPGKEADTFGEIEVTDNDIQYVDHEGISLRGRTLNQATVSGTPTLGRVALMRNRLHHISLRPKQSKNSPAINIGGGVTLAEVAGNEMIDCYGMGIYSVGGKSGGDERTIPLTRVLIYNNKADHVMTSANDWGQIAHWQGGPSYIFNNVASNATGYKNHIYLDWDKEGGLPRYVSNAYNYYGDGTYKSYWFNNLAWSDYDARTSVFRTQSPFMFVLGFQNYVVNNSAWNMNAGSNGSIGNRGGYLGNIFAHMNRRLISAGAKGDISVGGGGEAAIELNEGAITTTAFTQNLLADTLGAEQVVDIAGGGKRSDLDAVAEQNPIVGDVGVVVETSPFRDAGDQDFRPVPEAVDAATGVKFFMPWGLYATVGEWQFRHNPRTDPQVILGEHFYMTDEYVQRNMYYEVPRGDLIAPGATADTYVPGPLADWVPGGAMRFDGKSTFAMIDHDRLVADYETSMGFYDKKNLKDGTVVRATGEPLRKHRDELARLEELLANKGLKDPEKLRREAEQKQKQIDQRVEQIAELKAEIKEEEKVIALADTPEHRKNALRSSIKKKEESIAAKEDYMARMQKQVDENRKLLEEGDRKMVTKLRDQKIPQLKERIEKMEAEGLPDRFVYPGEKRQTVSIDTGNLLIEAYLRTEPGHSGGVIVGKMGDEAGYQVRIGDSGRPEFRLASGGETEVFSANNSINDGEWRHLLVEIDRDSGEGAFYLDGEPAGGFDSKLPADASLANSADFLVGKGNDGDYFAGDMDFLRVCRGTLEDSKTSIEELYAWQFDGPFLRDFAGRDRDFDKGA
ncbi:MAG: LamG-like jellyroll fold domain-containing protein, partial [Verrucomicrobiota bacterium]